jgi:hypothetical protein
MTLCATSAAAFLPGSGPIATTAAIKRPAAVARTVSVLRIELQALSEELSYNTTRRTGVHSLADFFSSNSAMITALASARGSCRQPGRRRFGYPNDFLRCRPSAQIGGRFEPGKRPPAARLDEEAPFLTFTCTPAGPLVFGVAALVEMHDVAFRMVAAWALKGAQVVSVGASPPNHTPCRLRHIGRPSCGSTRGSL